jgi:hypothetical protein
MNNLKKIFTLFIRIIIRNIYFFLDRIEYYTRIFFKKKNSVFLSNKSDKNKLTLAIFAIYKPKGLDFIIKRSITYLSNNAIKVIIVAPHSLSEIDLEFLNSRGCTTLVRSNFGRDFGSYQCGVFYLLNNMHLLNSIDNILFINDSIIFPIKENDNNLLEILNLPYQVVGITENYNYHWHISSYFILFKKEIFLHEEIKKFWKGYVPYSSRFHAISKGEVFLGKIMQKISCSYKVIYGGKELLEFFISNMYCKNFYEFHDLIHKNITYKDIRILDKIDIEKNFDLKNFSYLIESQSVMHIFALALIEYMNCFVMKKDICYRGYFPLNYIVQYVSTINKNVNFLEALSVELKEKGLPCSLTLFNRILYLAGAI